MRTAARLTSSALIPLSESAPPPVHGHENANAHPPVFLFRLSSQSASCASCGCTLRVYTVLYTVVRTRIYTCIPRCTIGVLVKNLLRERPVLSLDLLAVFASLALIFAPTLGPRAAWAAGCVRPDIDVHFMALFSRVPVVSYEPQTLAIYNITTGPKLPHICAPCD
jgi:hypothetical protein